MHIRFNWLMHCLTERSLTVPKQASNTDSHSGGHVGVVSDYAYLQKNCGIEKIISIPLVNGVRIENQVWNLMQNIQECIGVSSTSTSVLYTIDGLLDTGD